MVKVYSPLMSLEAAGSLAQTITYYRSVRHQAVKRRGKPLNPRSPKQTAIRSLMTHLSRTWSSLSSLEKESWRVCLEPSTASPYYSYLGHNQRRWQRKKPPTRLYPAAEASMASSAHGFSCFPHGDATNIRITNRAPPIATGYLLFRHTSSFFNPRWYYLVGAFPLDPGIYTWTADRPPMGFTYYYRHYPFNLDGVLGARSIERSFTPS